MSLLRSVQLSHLIGDAIVNTYTVPSPDVLDDLASSGVYGLDVTSDITSTEIPITASFDTTEGIYTTAWDSGSPANNTGSAANAESKIYLWNTSTGEALYYNESGDFQQVFGYLWSDSAVSPTGLYITLHYKNSAGSIVDLTTSSDAANVENYPASGGEISFRYCQTIQIKNEKPSNIVEASINIDQLDISIQAHEHIQELISHGAVNKGQSLGSLANTPKEAADVKLYINGQKQRYTQDYTVSAAGAITWAATADFDITAADEAIAEYEKGASS